MMGLKELLNLKAGYEQERRKSHDLEMSRQGCTAGHLNVADYPDVAIQQKHKLGHSEWKMCCTKHSVECLAIAPQWRKRPDKEAAGRADEYALKQIDGLYVDPKFGGSPTYDGRLVVAGKESVSDSRHDLINNFNKYGELILAVRRPQSNAETLKDGSPSFACYKIEGTPKRKPSAHEPGTSQHGKTKKARR